MSGEKMRKEFEGEYAIYAGLSVEQVSGEWDGNFYGVQGMRDAWWAWKASRKTQMAVLKERLIDSEKQAADYQSLFREMLECMDASTVNAVAIKFLDQIKGALQRPAGDPNPAAPDINTEGESR